MPGTPTHPTPSHTVGPFFGHALPFPGGGELAPPGHPAAVTVHGRVVDGAGAPVPDALVELWGPDERGRLPRTPGSLRRDAVTGGFLGRHAADFTGWGRVPTDAEGRWSARTLRPGARAGHAPYLAVCLFARGLLHHLFTRLYFPEDTVAHAADPLLAALPPERRRTLVATAGPHGAYRFDIRLQGGEETVFLEFR
ncbi:protocatechuate 3,4-dioxygenase subunit alpha [Streptomyces millisiae]|uniref:Protocatechuate 3,4-dioxygenase subunit alpha n=1 Tax=Streptomyces millisiae TaxID=3075542 RepID=A0ABU2LJQ8_9ACTN|nr:protocatechuate 3,4-dioxygenase subunit alpha [Streptomyces sp. DSM 44918]MDT0317502.1 protocatechuate 3,4-dioxygenase subunit alpha [Streptomyces sp. DSM 44918]